MNEQALAEMKQKTIPKEESIYYKSPLFQSQQPTTKQYSECEIVNQQAQFKQNYHNPKIKELMNDATKVLLDLMEKENKLPKE